MTKLFAELQGPLWRPGGLWKKNSRSKDYRGSQCGSWVAWLLTGQFLNRADSRWRARSKDKPSGKFSQWGQDWVRRSEIKAEACLSSWLSGDHVWSGQNQWLPFADSRAWSSVKGHCVCCHSWLFGRDPTCLLEEGRSYVPSVIPRSRSPPKTN